MQILGINFEKISAEKKKLPTGKIDIKSNIGIDSIESEKIELIKDKDALKFNFSFTIEYVPGIAEIKFKGLVLMLFEKDKAKEILKKWKTKKLDEAVRLPLFNLILTKCNLRALQFEEELNLPTHVPLPKLAPEQNNQGYVQ